MIYSVIDGYSGKIIAVLHHTVEKVPLRELRWQYMREKRELHKDKKSHAVFINQEFIGWLQATKGFKALPFKELEL